MAFIRSLAFRIHAAASISAIATFAAFPAQAEMFNYVCMDQGRSFALKVDDAENILAWRGEAYRIKESEDCAKFGWRAEKNGTSFDFCTATQGYADFHLNGTHVPCRMHATVRSTMQIVLAIHWLPAE